MTEPKSPVPHSAATPHRALCPSCQRLAVSETLTRSDSIREAVYLCPDDHLFKIKWYA